MTYTPERQLFPPGTKVKAVGKLNGKTYIGIVADANDCFDNGMSIASKVNLGLVGYWNNGGDTPINSYLETMQYHMATFTEVEDAPKQPSKSETQERTASMQSIKPITQSVREYVKPYEKYLVAAAVLLVLDHFVLKGAMTDRIQRLAQSLADRLAAMVDGLIARIGGE